MYIASVFSPIALIRGTPAKSDFAPREDMLGFEFTHVNKKGPVIR